MDDFVKGLGDLSAASAALITVFTLLALINKGLQYIASIPARIRSYLFRPKYIIIPTAEELASYCVKSFDSHRITIDEQYEELTHAYRRHIANFRRKASSRISQLYIFTFFVYSFLIFRIVHIRLIESQSPSKVATTALVALYSVMIGYIIMVPLWRILHSKPATSNLSWKRLSVWFWRSF